MLEGPAFQAAIGRLPDAPVHLAAWGLTMSISLIIESPVIMLLATAIALVRDRQSYHALRRFVLYLAVGCTVLTGIVAFTSLYATVSRVWMGQPAAIADAARPALQIMLFWTAAIAWRRFYQGLMVRCGQTRRVSWGTALRLAAAVAAAYLLAKAGTIPGAQVAAWAMMAGVIVEAIAAALLALPVVRREIAPVTAPSPPLTQGDILRFHSPLAATTLLTLLAQPMTSAALARLEHPQETLAVWPVVYMLLLVLRGGCLSLQEIAVAQVKAPDFERREAVLRRFTWLVGGASAAGALLIGTTPLLELYASEIISLPAALHPFARSGMLIGVLLPLLTALNSWARGLLVGFNRTGEVYRGMGIGLVAHVVLLTLGVVLRVPGMALASGALSLAMIAELVYLLRRLQPAGMWDEG